MLDLAVLAVFPGLMVYAAISDLLTMKIPNWVALTLAIAFFGLVIVMGLPLQMVGWHVLSAIVVLLVCFVFFHFRWMGGGDAKLAAATALWFGFGAIPLYGVITAIFGGILTFAILQIRHLELPEKIMAHRWIARLHQKTIGIPYGVALAAAGLVVYPNTIIWVSAISS